MGTAFGSNLSARGCDEEGDEVVAAVDDTSMVGDEDTCSSRLCMNFISNSSSLVVVVVVVVDDDGVMVSTLVGIGSNNGGSQSDVLVVAAVVDDDVVVDFPSAASIVVFVFIFFTINADINLDNDMSHLPSTVPLLCFDDVVVICPPLPFSGSNIGSTKTSPASGLLSK